MGWSGSAYYFCKLTHVFTYYLRSPSPPTPTPHPPDGRTTKRFLRNARWRGTCLIPYMDDFLFLADSFRAALIILRRRIEVLLDQLGLLRNPPKKSLDANASRRPLRAHHRPTLWRVLRPTNKAATAGPTSVLFSWPRGQERSLANGATSRGIRREA
jgi:hypothetical protein